MVTLILYAISVVGSALSPDYYLFIFFRFLTGYWCILYNKIIGMGVGGEYTAIFAAVDELIPPIHRGRTDIIIDGTWHFGFYCDGVKFICIRVVFGIYNGDSNASLLGEQSFIMEIDVWVRCCWDDPHSFLEEKHTGVSQVVVGAKAFKRGEFVDKFYRILMYE